MKSASVNNDIPANLLIRAPGRSWLDECKHRQPTLAVFALIMLALMIPGLIALGLDDRLIRGVNVWWKPLKFMASTSLFALSSAWFFGWLSSGQRTSPLSRVLVWTIIATSSFEVAYISIQAALGQASHHNVSDPFHAAMFVMMAIAAWTLTGTQVVLAWQIYRHFPMPGPDVLGWAIIAGLLFTFILGSASGMLLGAMQPPIGSGMPITHWHWFLQDFRPAHFLGVHAQQLMPLIGAAIAAQRPRRPLALLAAASMVYLIFWVLFVGWSLSQSH